MGMELTVGKAAGGTVVGSVMSGGPGTSIGMSGASNGGGEKEGDQPRKKLQKIYTTDQYICVTCGQMDSPEWRKGPLGLKTINACGLQGAKCVRMAEEKAKEVAATSTTTTNLESSGNGGAAAS